MLNLLQSSLKDCGVELSANVLAREEQFLQEMLRWNKRVNLTAINDLSDALEKHLIDSLLLLKYVNKEGCLLDMGSGAGLPGIPLAIALPELQVTSVDSVGKKINFQKHIRRLLNMKNLTPICSRLEDLKPDVSFDLVIARALSNFSDLLNWAHPVMSENGTLYIMKGPEGRVELDAFLGKESAHGFSFEKQYTYRLPLSKAERQLYILTRNKK